jgi:GntR family transcriptional regulator, galactonate operon transcriptional repressor
MIWYGPRCSPGDPQVRSYHDQIVDLLGRRMVSGELAPGSRMPPEAPLAESLGVSRLALREAMKTLAAKGMVSIRTRTGTHVQPRHAWNLFDAGLMRWHVEEGMSDQLMADLLELRRMIEPAAARTAAARATKEALRSVRTAYNEMTGAPSQEAYIEADLRFHAAVLDACGNQFIRQLQGTIRQVLQASFAASSSPSPLQHARALAMHEALVLALESRDEDATQAAMEALIDRAAERIRGARTRSGGRRRSTSA